MSHNNLATFVLENVSILIQQTRCSLIFPFRLAVGLLAIVCNHVVVSTSYAVITSRYRPQRNHLRRKIYFLSVIVLA